MFGKSAYGTTAYGSIGIYVTRKIVRPETLTGTGILNDPTIAITELALTLEGQGTLQTPTVVITNKEIIIKINGIDISDQINFNSVFVTNNLYSDPNTASFQILNPENKSYIPSAGDEVEIYDTGSLIFSGVLIRKDKSINGLVENLTLEFKDWQEELGNILVDEVYTNETVEDIIADIFTTLTDYDGETNVSDTTNVARIVFDNISVVECLDRLAELSGKNWYVAPNKDIYFFADNGLPAPFGLTDINGRYFFGSLNYTEDLTQIRNKVTVKGNGISAVTVQDATSQSTYGLREYFIRNDEIKASNEATQLANSILASYKDAIKIISFETQEQGLKAGQQITIESTIRNINETLNIEKVNFQADSKNRFFYSVTATSQRLNGINDLFNQQTIETADNLPVGDQGNLQDIEFTAIDDKTIQWSSGSIITSDGTVYSISANSSQVLTGDHIIYLDPAVSVTALQISTTFSQGIGQGKIPLAYATKSAVATKGASIFPVSFGQKIQLDGGVHITDRSIIADNIAANSITANEIAANTITANEITTGELITLSAQIKNAIITDAKIANATITSAKIISLDANKVNAATLSAISANLGTITAGDITSATYTSKSITTSSGRACRIDGDSTKNIKFYYNGDLEAWIQTNLASGGENEYARFEADSGRSLRLRESNVGCDGNFIPTSDNAYTCGASNRRWSDGRFEDITVDDLFVLQSFNPPGINEINLLNEEQKERFSKVQKKEVTKKEIQDRVKKTKGKKGDVEIELQREKHLASKLYNPTGFELGDVLVWKNGELALCEEDMDTKVMAVSSPVGMPCIIGGEPIKVIGKVEEGDFLVTSSTKGYAKAEKEPRVGTVIAQALEASNKTGLIKAMIRKF